MLKKRHLIFITLLFHFVACSSPVKQITIPNETIESRSIANKETGISYPENFSFDLNNHLGKTYTNFMKTKVKPALDHLGDVNNGGGGGFDNIGAHAYLAQNIYLDKKTLSGYKGAKWNRQLKKYEGGLRDDQVELVYNELKKVKVHSTVDSLTYFDRNDKTWSSKNDMAIALKSAKINAAPFDLATLYALTGGIGVKVKIDENNYNYHVLYKTGHTKPHEEVMSGRSFASSISHGASDATDPEYLRDLKKYLDSASDIRSFYRALVLVLANSDTKGWKDLNDLGQSVLSDFLTVYTAEADRHLMVDLQDGNHPWEIDLAAVTVVSALSAKTGKVVMGGVSKESDLGGWFAPSPNNKPDGPQRSGIGITRKDRQKLQRAIHSFEMTTPDGKELIAEIQNIVGSTYNKNDVIQGVFEFLSNKYTPETMGENAAKLADLVSRFVEIAHGDAEEIFKLIPQS